MRLSRTLITTLREDPADVEITSHRLLVRAGYIHKLAAGLYTYSTLMMRVLEKISDIIRQELNKDGAQEILMPIMQPKEIWLKSGRWARYIEEGIMFHMPDKKRSEVCLGPTHEEVVTTYVNSIVQSHKQLPVMVYQIQEKFRDEIRPRFGLIRCREFLMKDAYSFDIDEKGLDSSYQIMNRAYHRIFERCGLKFKAVEADAGAIGGSGSKEFMAPASVGEDSILACSVCDYAANVEKADSTPHPTPDNGEPAPIEKHATPDIRTVAQLESFFKMEPTRMAKTVLYKAVFDDRQEVVAVMMRGDLEINEVKLVNELDALSVELADEKTVKETTGTEIGFVGPVNLDRNGNVRLLADLSLKGATNLLTGCCETGFHCLKVNVARDCPELEWRGLRKACAGEGCVNCKDGRLEESRGIEVGHIFKLGVKYSESMNATFAAENGKPKPFVMGCYGIGVSRTAAAAVEQYNDQNGIIWPRSISPFEVVIAVLDTKRLPQREMAEQLYEELRNAGVDVCLDDRKMSPGAKFKDLDLLGFPIRVVIGRKAEEQIVEFSYRHDRKVKELPASKILSEILTSA